MKKVLLLCFITLNLGWIKAQTHPIFGEEFNLDTSIEENPQIVLQDNYNHYLATVTSKGKLHIIFRKFDQQNQLVDTYTQDYAINPNTLHNVKGTFQVDANRVVTFIESYSGKTKQAEVYQYVFDKSTSKFTSTVLGTYPFVSVSKSGTLYITASQNGNYLGIVYQNYNAKGEPEVSDYTVLNAKTLEKVYKKSVTYNDEFYTSERVMSNNGAILLLRTPRSWKGTNYLSVVTAEGEATKNVEPDTKLFRPIAVSINNQDYLIAFNHRTKGIRRGDFGDIMFYDITQGSVLKNNPVEGFNSIKDIKEVNFRYAFMQNNEFHVFVESIFPQGTKPSPSFPNNPAFNQPIMNYGGARLLVFDLTGTLKQNIVLTTNNDTEVGFYHSYGVTAVKGNYFVNTGLYYKNSYNYGFYKIDPTAGFAVSNTSLQYTHNNDYSFKSVNQLLDYNSDTKTLLLARTSKDNKMSFVRVPMP
jgi:hypothetical protein